MTAIQGVIHTQIKGESQIISELFADVCKIVHTIKKYIIVIAITYVSKKTRVFVFVEKSHFFVYNHNIMQYIGTKIKIFSKNGLKASLFHQANSFCCATLTHPSRQVLQGWSGKIGLFPLKL